MTRQTEATLISALLHGLIVAAILTISRPEAARKPALELDFHFIEPRQALASIPPAMEPAAEVKPEEPVAAPPMPEEKREPQPVPPPVLEKPKKTVVKPKVSSVKPTPAPQSETRAVATQPRESLPVAEEAATPAEDTGTPSAPPAANLLAAQGDHPAGFPSSQTAPGPLRDVTFGQGSGPSFAQRIIPEYPWRERRLGNQGKVVLRLHISRQGTLESVEIVESGGPLFDKASLQAVRASSYHPAMAQGTPVDSTALLPIKFNLENGNGGGG